MEQTRHHGVFGGSFRLSLRCLFTQFRNVSEPISHQLGHGDADRYLECALSLPRHD